MSWRNSPVSPPALSVVTSPPVALSSPLWASPPSPKSFPPPPSVSFPKTTASIYKNFFLESGQRGTIPFPNVVPLYSVSEPLESMVPTIHRDNLNESLR